MPEAKYKAKQPRDQRFEARLSAVQKRKFEKAAAIAGTSMAGFIISAAERAASDIIEQDERILVSDKDMEALLRAINAEPRKPTAEAARAVRDYKRLVEQKDL